MASKRALVHAACDGCGAGLPLGACTLELACASCSWRGNLAPGDWAWVLDDNEHRVESTSFDHKRITGETDDDWIECPTCAKMIGEEIIAAAWAAKATEVICPGCQTPLSMRAVPAWTASYATALIGEALAPAAASPVRLDVACSNCGAHLDVDGSTPSPACSFCGTHTALSPALWRELHPPPRAHAFFVWTSHAMKVAAVQAGDEQLARMRAAAAPDPDPPPSRSWIWGIAGSIALPVVIILAIDHISSSSHSTIAEPNGECGDVRAACSADRKAQLVCQDDKFVVALTCKGPLGCRLTDHGKIASCDYTLADLGDPCDVKDSACSTDGKSELHCDGAKFVLQSTCLGPDGCTVTPQTDSNMLSCDDHIAPVGSPCLPDGRFACSLDKASMLRCTRGHFIFAATCRGPKACSLTTNAAADTKTVICDHELAEIGDPCDAGAACSVDGNSLLRCDNGHFALVKACDRGCFSSVERIECR